MVMRIKSIKLNSWKDGGYYKLDSNQVTFILAYKPTNYDIYFTGVFDLEMTRYFNNAKKAGSKRVTTAVAKYLIQVQ